MALTFGRLVPVAVAPRNSPQNRETAIRGKVISREVADGALRVRQMIAQAESQIAEKWVRFEETLDSTRADMLRQARAEVDCALSAKFIELSMLRQREVERSSEDIVQLARLLAERILRDELRANPEQLTKFAERCIAEARGSRSVVIHANPDDIHVLRGPLEALAVQSALTLQLLPKPELLRGDLHIESDVGKVDARLGTQLANLAATLRESLRP